MGKHTHPHTPPLTHTITFDLEINRPNFYEKKLQKQKKKNN